jgi:Rrf2 family nitric oxide-sensitive transcriptional repressor
MLLTRHTDYSLRFLMYLALNDARNVTIREVARSFKVPRNHLMKISQALARHGYIHTIRGRGGGLRLAREPGAINVRDVVSDMEPTLEIFDCQNPLCPIAGSCVLKKALMEARDHFLAALGKYTLADLVRQKRKLRRHLAA